MMPSFRRALAFAVALSLLTVAGAAPAAAAEAVDLRPRYETGRTYRLTEEMLFERKMRGQTRYERTTTVIERRVDKGGVVGVDAIVLKDKVTRVKVKADDGRREWTWDSDDGPPATEEQAAVAVLLGATYTVEIAPSGEVTVKDLVRDLAPLEKYGWDEDLMDMLKASTSEAALASKMNQRGVAPDKPVKRGATWTSSATIPNGPQLEYRWKLTSTKGDRAVVKGTAKLPKKLPTGAPLKGRAARAELVYDTAAGLLASSKVEAKFSTKVGKLRFGIAFEMTLKTELLPKAAAE